MDLHNNNSSQLAKILWRHTNLARGGGGFTFKLQSPKLTASQSAAGIYECMYQINFFFAILLREAMVYLTCDKSVVGDGELIAKGGSNDSLVYVSR